MTGRPVATLYACRDCGTLIEFLGERPGPAERVCDECGGELRRSSDAVDAHILKRVTRPKPHMIEHHR